MRSLEIQEALQTASMQKQLVQEEGKIEIRPDQTE
jgi:hypothetical protein